MRNCPQCGIPLNLHSTFGPEQGPPIGVGTIVLGVMSVFVLGMLCLCGTGLWLYQSTWRAMGLPPGPPPRTIPSPPIPVPTPAPSVTPPGSP
jgi:hypothetical protein